MVAPPNSETFESYNVGDTPYPNLFEILPGLQVVGSQRATVANFRALSGTKSAGKEGTIDNDSEYYANIYYGTCEFGEENTATGKIWMNHLSGQMGTGSTDLLFVASLNDYFLQIGVVEFSAFNTDGLVFSAYVADSNGQAYRSSDPSLETGWYTYEVRIRGALESSEVYCAVTAPSGAVVLPGMWENTGTAQVAALAPGSTPGLEPIGSSWHIVYDNPVNTFWDDLTFSGSVSAPTLPKVRMYPIGK